MMDDFHSIAQEFFVEQGWSCEATIVRVMEYGYNPSTSRPLTNTEEYAVRAILFDYVNKTEGDTTKTNTQVRSGDKQIFIQPYGLLSSIDASTDKVKVGGVTYDIVTCKTFNPNLSGAVYFEVYGRV